MKTTLNLPDELMREIKIRAAQENRRLQDLIAELLRKGLAQQPEAPLRRTSYPIIQCTKRADDLTPERIAEILLEQEIP